MLSVPTFTATVFVGFRETDTGAVHTLHEAETIAQIYVNRVGLCITLTPTQFIYTNGSEPGCMIGLINYPRFPSDQEGIEYHAQSIAAKYMHEFRQQRVSILFADKTIMLTAEEATQ